eukprot:s2378_g10.t1
MATEERRREESEKGARLSRRSPPESSRKKRAESEKEQREEEEESAEERPTSWLETGRALQRRKEETCGAAEEEEPHPGGEGEAVLEAYRRGEEVEAAKIEVGSFKKGDWIAVNDGVYFQQKRELAAKVIREEVEDGEREVVCELTGTTSEELLRFGTSRRPCQIKLHVCRRECPQLRENPNLVHMQKCRKLRPEDPKRKGKAAAKKTLEAVYKDTGLDPDPKRRRRLMKRVKKALKKTRDSSSSSSTTSEETSSDLDTDELLQDRSRVHRIAALGPGLLAAQSVNTMRQYLTQLSGFLYDADIQGLPPLLSLYHRQFVAQKLSGGVSREFTTLAWIGDMLLQARPAEALDGVLQRMKSIEYTADGSPWGVSQKIELVPQADASMGSRQEYQLARREAKLDNAVKVEVNRQRKEN